MKFHRSIALILFAGILSVGAERSRGAEAFVVYKDAGAGSWAHYTTLANAIIGLGATPGTIYLPAGTFTTASTITLTTGQSLVGTDELAGSVINTTSLTNTMIDVTGDGVSILGVNLGRTNTTPWTTAGVLNLTGDGIDLNGNNNILIEHCGLNHHNNGIVDTSDSNDVTIEGTTITSCANSCIKMDTLVHNGILIRKCQFGWSGGGSNNTTLASCVSIKGPTSGTEFIFVYECKMYTVLGNGFSFTGDNIYMRENNVGGVAGNVVSISDSKNVRIISGYYHSSGITVTRGTNISDAFTANYATRSAFGYAGINVAAGTTASEDINIENVALSYNNFHGIYMDRPKNAKVIGCTVHSNGQKDGTGAGIYIVNAYSDVSLQSNHCFNDNALATALLSQDYGIRVTGAGNYLHVLGNNTHDSNGWQATGITVAGPPANYANANNL